MPAYLTGGISGLSCNELPPKGFSPIPESPKLYQLSQKMQALIWKNTKIVKNKIKPLIFRLIMVQCENKDIDMGDIFDVNFNDHGDNVFGYSHMNPDYIDDLKAYSHELDDRNYNDRIALGDEMMSEYE